MSENRITVGSIITHRSPSRPNRLFEDVEMPRCQQASGEGQPSLLAITRLLLRRQTREPRDLEKLITLLPNLRELCYESWREWSLVDQRWPDQNEFSECLIGFIS